MRRRFAVSLICAGLALATLIAGLVWMRGAAQDAGGALRLETKRVLATKGTPTAIAWSPDGKRLAAVSDFGGQVTTWNRDGSRLSEFHREGTYLETSLAFMLDNRTLIVPAPIKKVEDEKFTFALVDSDTGRLKQLVPGPEPGKGRQSNAAYSFAISRDGLYVANSPSDNTAPVTVYSTMDWRVVRSISIDKSIPFERPSALAFSSGGDMLAIGKRNGEVIFVDIANLDSKPAIIAGYPRENPRVVGSLDFSPDGRLLALGKDLELDAQKLQGVLAVKVWDLTASRFFSVDGAPTDTFVRKLSWSADSRYLAAVASDDKLGIYTVSDKAKLSATMVFTTLMSVGFAPDGNDLAVASSQGVTLLNVLP